jgi:hypothetical protein
MDIPDLEALMKTMIPAHAEHHLTQVADRFDHWRQTRTTPAEPIPHDLWEQAIALTAMFPITRVARRLRVSGGELKKRCAAVSLRRPCLTSDQHEQSGHSWHSGVLPICMGATPH